MPIFGSNSKLKALHGASYGIQKPGGAGGAAWTPLSLSPTIWVHPESGYVENGGGTPDTLGDRVQEWTDASGNGNDLVQGTLAEMPYYNNKGGRPDETVNGYVPLSADSSQDLASSGMGGLSLPFTVLLVGISDVDLDYFHGNAGAGGNVLFYSNSYWTINNGIAKSSGVAIDGLIHYYTAVFSSSAGQLHIDGGANTITGSTGTATLGEAIIFNFSSGSTAGIQGQIFEYVLVPGAISDDDRAQWDAYASAKYGI